MHLLFHQKIKKELVLLMHLKKIIKQSNKKPNKIWLDQGNEFYNQDF